MTEAAFVTDTGLVIETFNPVAGVASAQGLDVSNFQGHYDWAGAVKAVPNLAFGVFRLTEGAPPLHDNSPDPDAAWNHAQIRDAGLYRGAYHFLHPSLPGKAQAEYFVSEHEKLGITNENMLWLDNETTDGLGPAAVAQCAQDFMAELKVLRPDNPMGVYSFINFADQGYCDGLGQYPLWLARPGSTAPTAPPPWHNWSVWQWGTRAGTDADAFNGTVADFKAWIASFQPKPAGPYKHLTVQGDTVTSLAAKHNMQPGSFLSMQGKLGGSAIEDTFGSGPVPVGTEYLTVNP